MELSKDELKVIKALADMELSAEELDALPSVLKQSIRMSWLWTFLRSIASFIVVTLTATVLMWDKIKSLVMGTPP